MLPDGFDYCKLPIVYLPKFIVNIFVAGTEKLGDIDIFLPIFVTGNMSADVFTSDGKQTCQILKMRDSFSLPSSLQIQFDCRELQTQTADSLL